MDRRFTQLRRSCTTPSLANTEADFCTTPDQQDTLRAAASLQQALDRKTRGADDVDVGLLGKGGVQVPGDRFLSAEDTGGSQRDGNGNSDKNYNANDDNSHNGSSVGRSNISVVDMKMDCNVFESAPIREPMLLWKMPVPESELPTCSTAANWNGSEVWSPHESKLSEVASVSWEQSDVKELPGIGVNEGVQSTNEAQHQLPKIQGLEQLRFLVTSQELVEALESVKMDMQAKLELEVQSRLAEVELAMEQRLFSLETAYQQLAQQREPQSWHRPPMAKDGEEAATPPEPHSAEHLNTSKSADCSYLEQITVAELPGGKAAHYPVYKMVRRNLPRPQLDRDHALMATSRSEPAWLADSSDLGASNNADQSVGGSSCSRKSRKWASNGDRVGRVLNADSSEMHMQDTAKLMDASRGNHEPGCVAHMMGPGPSSFPGSPLGSGRLIPMTSLSPGRVRRATALVTRVAGEAIPALVDV